MSTETMLTEVEGEFDAVAGHLNAQHARMVKAAAWLLDNVEEWQGDGLWTPEAFVAWRTGVARTTASKVVDVARRIDEFPECVEVMARGELSLDQIVPIVRHAPGWADAQMSGLATRLTVPQISKVARQYPWDRNEWGRPILAPDADPDDASIDPDASTADGSTVDRVSEPAAPVDEAWSGWDDQGRFRLHVNVGADSGLLLDTALAECRDRLFHSRTDTDAVSTVEAVLEMANRSLDTVESHDRRNRYRVNVHVDASSGTVTDARGRPVPDGPARRITCDALLSAVAFDDGVAVSVGRTRHIVPDRTRRLVEHRDGGCRVPGCDSDRFVEVHHIVHWSDGGCTDTENLVCLCPKHHRLHHQGRLGIEGDADRPPDTIGAVEFLDRHGTRIRPSGASPTPPVRPPPPIDGRWEHPLAERLEMRWLYFNDDPNRPPPITTASHSLADR